MAKSSVNGPSVPAPVEALTARGRKTRDALLDAARIVFETVGFPPDSRVEQISQESNVSYGTFYRYFESKEDIFRELSTRLFEDVHRREPSDTGLSPAPASSRRTAPTTRRTGAMRG